MNLDMLKRSLITHEGIRTTPYVDTTGNLSIGVGHNLTANGLPMSIIWTLLDADILEATQRIARYPWYDDLDDVRQRVMVEMMFNMGPATFATFRLLIAAMAERRYASAALEMMHSTWAAQVGSRATHLAEMMRLGKDPGQ